MEETSLDTCARILGEFFKNDPKKITYWWFTKNPMLGGVSPAHLYIHRPEKVALFIKNLAEGNIA